MARDEKHQQAMLHHIENNMTDPFCVGSHPPEELINISTGMIASYVVRESLLSAVELGRTKAQDFLSTRLASDGQKSFYDPIKKSGIQTFHDMQKKTKVRVSGGLNNLRVSPELVFRRALTLSECRADVTLQSVLSRPITSIPTSLFNEDGTMRKNKKSDMVACIEERIEPSSSLPPGTLGHRVYIRDAMSVIQAIRGDNFVTFSDLAKHYTEHLMTGFNKADTVIEVYDRYDSEMSIKDAERQRRQAHLSAYHTYHVKGGRNVPSWRKFLAVSQNKASLASYLTTHLETQFPVLATHSGHKLVLSGGTQTDRQEVKCISRTGSVTIPDGPDHEEADTRMVYHAAQCD